MIACYNELNLTSSSNDKLAILKKYGSDPVVKEAIRLCYEPFIHTYLINIPKPKSVGSLTFHQSFPAFAELFNDLNERKVTGNASRNAVQSFLETVDSDSQDVYIKILKKDLKVGIAEKTVLKAFGDGFINLFEVQLGQPYSPDRVYKIDKKKEVEFWWTSPKLNGIRGFQEGTDDLRTRNGNKIYGFDHVLSEIADLKARYGLEFVDGELYDFGIPFQTINSYVSKEKNIIPEHKQRIKFNIFAVGIDRDWKDTEEMIRRLESIDWSRYTYLKQVPYERIKNDPDVIFEAMNLWYENGYEGIMLRHPFRCWAKGRSHDIVKVKPVLEGDFRIIGFEIGKPDGENWNTLGALVIQGEYTLVTKDPKTNKKIETIYPIRCNCGSGFKKKPELGVTRDEIWNNKDLWLDTISEIHFQAITDKPDKDGFYALQFPRFHCKKVDKML